MTLDGSFAGRVVAVTGGARGIGDAIVDSFRVAGARVVVLDRLEPHAAREGVRYTLADVSDPESVAAAFATIDAGEGRLDVLVNNAGFQRAGLIGQLPYEDWAAVIGTHLTGMFLCSSQAVPRMIAQGAGGAIVSIASTAGLVGLPGRGPYCAAKAGIMGLTRAMALEGAPVGIRVNAVAPGYTRTEMIQQALDDGSQREEWMLERVPLKRLADPDEIARVVRFLASTSRIVNNTPFTAIQHMTTGHFSAIPLVVMTVLAIVFAVAGLVRLRNRDVVTG